MALTATATKTKLQIIYRHLKALGNVRKKKVTQSHHFSPRPQPRAWKIRDEDKKNKNSASSGREEEYLYVQISLQKMTLCYSIAPPVFEKQSLFSSYQVRTKKPDYYETSPGIPVTQQTLFDTCNRKEKRAASPLSGFVEA